MYNEYMKYFSTLIKPSSAACNLNCAYCFYKDEAKHRAIENHGIMSKTMVETMLDRIFDYFKDDQTMITFAFQGGEPTLAGIEWFNHFFDTVSTKRKPYHHIRYSIQTNGYIMDEKWIDLFKTNHVLVGLSIDGYGSNHDQYRIRNDGQTTFDTIINHYDLLIANHVDVNILTVITHDLASHANALYGFYQNYHMDYIQLIPCLPPYGKTSGYAFKPQDYPLFFGELWQCYIHGFNHGYRPYINWFDQWMSALIGLTPSQCGANGYCAMQYVTEADGSVYPCDFYCLDHYRIGSWSNHDPQSLMLSLTTKAFLKENTLPTLCKSCKYQSICHGQCKRQQVCFMDETTSYCGIRSFLDEYGSSMLEMAKYLVKTTY